MQSPPSSTARGYKPPSRFPNVSAPVTPRGSRGLRNSNICGGGGGTGGNFTQQSLHTLAASSSPSTFSSLSRAHHARRSSATPSPAPLAFTPHASPNYSYSNNNNNHRVSYAADESGAYASGSFSSSVFASPTKRQLIVPQSPPEERTLLGKGTTGSGAAWEPLQSAAKNAHLAEWEKKRMDQIKADVARKGEKKAEEDRNAQYAKEKRRQTFLENRFTAVYFTSTSSPHRQSASAQSFNNNVAATATLRSSSASSPTAGAGTVAGSYYTADASSPPPPPLTAQAPAVVVNSVVHSRSPAERRERSMLPASATSPLRQRHYKAVLDQKANFVKERARWDEERRSEIEAHEAYIKTMHNESMSGAGGVLNQSNGGTLGYSSPRSHDEGTAERDLKDNYGGSRGSVARFSRDSVSTSPQHTNNNNNNSTYNHSKLARRSTFACVTDANHGSCPAKPQEGQEPEANHRSPSLLLSSAAKQTNRSKSPPMFPLGGTSSSILNSTRSSSPQSPLVPNPYVAPHSPSVPTPRDRHPYTLRLSASATGSRRSPDQLYVRTTSPNPDYVERCREEVLRQRAEIEQIVSDERVEAVNHNRASRQLIVASHYQTFKAVQDVAAQKGTIVEDLRDKRIDRDTSRKALTREIRSEKHKYQMKEREENKELSKQAAYNRRRKARDAAAAEVEAEKARMKQIAEAKEAELIELQISAEQRKVHCPCERERSPSARASRNGITKHEDGRDVSSPRPLSSARDGSTPRPPPPPPRKYQAHSFTKRDSYSSQVTEEES